jgi:hypothetical protein
MASAARSHVIQSFLRRTMGSHGKHGGGDAGDDEMWVGPCSEEEEVGEELRERLEEVGDDVLVMKPGEDQQDGDQHAEEPADDVSEERAVSPA